MLWHVAVHALLGRGPVGPKVLDEGFRLFDVKKTGILPFDLQASVTGMNTALPVFDAIDRIASVELIEERVDRLLAASDRAFRADGEVVGEVLAFLEVVAVDQLHQGHIDFS